MSGSNFDFVQSGRQPSGIWVVSQYIETAELLLRPGPPGSNSGSPITNLISNLLCYHKTTLSARKRIT